MFSFAFYGTYTFSLHFPPSAGLMWSPSRAPCHRAAPRPAPRRRETHQQGKRDPCFRGVCKRFASRCHSPKQHTKPEKKDLFCISTFLFPVRVPHHTGVLDFMILFTKNTNTGKERKKTLRNSTRRAQQRNTFHRSVSTL